MGQVEDLRAFVQIIEQGSISKAADTLNIAKSAVSRRLNLLEDRYGSVLINRQPGSWRVTDTGKELYQRAVTVIGEIDDMEGDFSQEHRSIEGGLSISVAHEFGLVFLGPALIDFKQQHPDIQLNVVFDNRPVDLALENFDMAIRITPQDLTAPNTTFLGASYHRLYASPDYLNDNGTPDCVADLKRHSLLNYGTAKRTEWSFKDASGRTSKVIFKPAMGSNSGVFLLDAVKRGMGISRLPNFVGKAYARDEDTVSILEHLAPSPLNIFLLHAEHRRVNRRMRVFSESMQQACAHWVEKLHGRLE